MKGYAHDQAAGLGLLPFTETLRRLSLHLPPPEITWLQGIQRSRRLSAGREFSLGNGLRRLSMKTVNMHVA